VAVFWRDIAPRRRVEAELRASEARYRALFERMDQGFCIVEVLFDADERPTDYRFVETNPVFVAQTGLADAVGRTARELVPNLERYWIETYARVAATGEPFRFQSGSEAMGREFDVYAFRVGDPAARRVALLFSDVTAARAAERERDRLLAATEAARAEAEAARAAAESASRAKSEFLAVMSHELRTPLNAIGGYAELMTMGIRGPITDRQREDLGRIQTNQRHLLGLINEVLNYARIEAGMVRYDLADVDLGEVVASVEPLVAPQLDAKRLAYAHDGCGAAPAVARADREKLRQVLLNLLSNAIKFTEPGGRVEVGCATDGDRALLHVRDTGIGIAPDARERVFEPFVQVDARLTRPHEGAGLGLAISRDLARGMGGDLTFESVPGGGSTFTVALPAARAAAPGAG
jgi:signal transduction histidine kinase